jgi:cell division protein FtsB
MSPRQVPNEPIHIEKIVSLEQQLAAVKIELEAQKNENVTLKEQNEKYLSNPLPINILRL